MSCSRRSRSQAVCVTHVIRVRSRMSSESVNRQPVRDVSTCFDRSNGRIHREKRPLDTTKAKAIPIPIQVTNEDVFLLKVQSLSAGVSQTSMQRFGILAQGQVTGHAHRIVKNGLVQRYGHDGRAYAFFKKTAILTHEEHGKAPLEPRVYQFIIERDYDPSLYAPRTVIG